MYLIDLGDAMVETKQMAPGTKPDSVYVFGIRSGSPEEDLDVGRWMLESDAEGQ
jgi:hypothetical protein